MKKIFIIWFVTNLICYRSVIDLSTSIYLAITQTVFSWCFSNFLSSIFEKIAFANIFEVPKFSISLCKTCQPYHEKPNASEMKTTQEKLKYLNKITDLLRTFQPAFTHLKLTKWNTRTKTTLIQLFWCLFC